MCAAVELSANWLIHTARDDGTAAEEGPPGGTAVLQQGYVMLYIKIRPSEFLQYLNDCGPRLPQIQQSHEMEKKAAENFVNFTKRTSDHKELQVKK